jgi:hypothetical protein
MYEKKYRIIQDKNGVKDYNHLDEWKDTFKKAKKSHNNKLTIGDMPEWYELLKKYVEKKKQVKQYKHLAIMLLRIILFFLTKSYKLVIIRINS